MKGQLDFSGLLEGPFGREKEERDERRSFTQTQKNEIWSRQKGRCARCHRQLSPSSTHYDHIKPYEEGGKTVVSNGQALCATCHSEKSNKDRLKKVDKKRTHGKSEENYFDALVNSGPL